MPNSKSAIKALEASRRKAVFNARRKQAIGRAIKSVKKAAVSKAGDTEALLSEAYQAIDKAAKRGIIKKNTAARKKSRLARSLRKAA